MIAIPLLLLLLFGGGGALYTPDKPRAALEAQYAPPPSQFLTVAGIRLHVRDTGPLDTGPLDTGPHDAPALILLHGLGSSLHTWEAWAALLSPRYRVIRYDQPGFGLTGADPTGDYTDARSLAVLAALMDRLGVARATVVGSSMGGRIAWRFAAAHPERVERLVLVSPDGYASPGIAYGTPAEVPAMMRLLPYAMPTSMLRASIAPGYADPSKLTEATVARYRDMMLAPGVRRALLARMRQHVLTDPRPILAAIQAPTLLLWGERDAMIPVGNSADYLAALPHARLARLPGLGHVPMEEAPEVSLAPVLAFLSGGP